MGHVTGRTQYFEDVNPPGCCTCGCTAPSATTRRSSTSTPSAAEQVKGVVKVLTHADVPNNWYTVLKLINVGYDDEPVLAEGKVMYRGEPIVAVVATSERAAREGAAAVKVTYEDLPHVLDVEEAIKPETPVIKPHGHNHFIYEGHQCRRVRFGDVAAGLRRGRPHLRVATTSRARSSRPRRRPRAAS